MEIEEITKKLLEKQKKLNVKDDKLVKIFWEIFDTIPTDKELAGNPESQNKISEKYQTCYDLTMRKYIGDFIYKTSY